MTANELRIGNWVFWDDPSNEQVQIFSIQISETIDGENSFVNGGLIDDFKPIPLTEEWLLKFRFVPVNDDGLYQNPNEELFQVQDLYLQGIWGHIWDTSFTEAPIQYVHQLQNLYFALTGEELTIK